MQDSIFRRRVQKFDFKLKENITPSANKIIIHTY